MEGTNNKYDKCNEIVNSIKMVALEALGFEDRKTRKNCLMKSIKLNRY